MSDKYSGFERKEITSIGFLDVENNVPEVLPEETYGNLIYSEAVLENDKDLFMVFDFDSKKLY